VFERQAQALAFGLWFFSHPFIVTRKNIFAIGFVLINISCFVSQTGVHYIHRNTPEIEMKTWNYEGSTTLSRVESIMILALAEAITQRRDFSVYRAA
jgi:hypothetical protein